MRSSSLYERSSCPNDRLSFEPPLPVGAKYCTMPSRSDPCDVNVTQIVTAAILEMENACLDGDGSVLLADSVLPRSRRSVSAASASPHVSTSSASTNPCDGLGLGPHGPPMPASPFERRRAALNSFFVDPLSQYMEDRMAQFRPTPSQNNIDTALNFAHPYQLAEEDRPSKVLPKVRERRVPVALDPNSSYSFLAYYPLAKSTATGIAQDQEPGATTMIYTPEAAPVVESKRDELEAGNCWCFM